MIGCMYNVLAKILANMLRKVMHKVIKDTQVAFIHKIQILDGVLITNELVEEIRSGRALVLFKVDFEKTYDSVDWEFLLLVMERMGFPKQLRD